MARALAVTTVVSNRALPIGRSSTVPGPGSKLGEQGCKRHPAGVQT
jgi:hypothetical protein